MLLFNNHKSMVDKWVKFEQERKKTTKEERFDNLKNSFGEFSDNPMGSILGSVTKPITSTIGSTIGSVSSAIFGDTPKYLLIGGAAILLIMIMK